MSMASRISISNYLILKLPNLDVPTALLQLSVVTNDSSNLEPDS